MKRVLSIVLCLMLVGSLFTLAISANAVEDDSAVAVAADQTLADTDVNIEPTDDITADVTDAPDEDETVADETVADETTTDETTAEETIVPTTAETTAETTAATEVTATKDQKKASPKTGENIWLWIGIGIFAVALIAIIATVIAKKKAK